MRRFDSRLRLRQADSGIKMPSARTAAMVHVGSYLDSWLGGGETWWGYPPYGEGSGSVAGENPVVWVTEFYGSTGCEGAGSISDLGARQIVGFRMTVGISTSRVPMGRTAILRASLTCSATTSG